MYIYKYTYMYIYKYIHITSLDLWKHHVNLLLQSFRSVSSDLCRANNSTDNKNIINNVINNSIISNDEDPSLRIESFAIINYVVFPQR